MNIRMGKTYHFEHPKWPRDMYCIPLDYIEGDVIMDVYKKDTGYIIDTQYL